MPRSFVETQLDISPPNLYIAQLWIWVNLSGTAPSFYWINKYFKYRGTCGLLTLNSIRSHTVAYIHITTLSLIYIYIHLCKYTHILDHCVYIYINIYIYIYQYLCIYIYTYFYIYILYTCHHIYIYICITLYTDPSYPNIVIQGTEMLTKYSDPMIQGPWRGSRRGFCSLPRRCGGQRVQPKKKKKVSVDHCFSLSLDVRSVVFISWILLSVGGILSIVYHCSIHLVCQINVVKSKVRFRPPIDGMWSAEQLLKYQEELGSLKIHFWSASAKGKNAPTSQPTYNNHFPASSQNQHGDGLCTCFLTWKPVIQPSPNYIINHSKLSIGIIWNNVQE